MFQFAGLSSVAEIDAAILQIAVTLLLAVAAWTLHRRYRKPYLAWFTAAFGLYVLRLLAIVSFLWTRQWGFLYWHQVLTGWTALAILWAAIQFSRPRPPSPRSWHLLALAFPPAWSYVAIYQMESFLAAALPAVLFLSLVTAWAGRVFLRHWYRVRGVGSALLSGSLLLWALHHLDYPFLRARGAWVPWGYYLDIFFLLLVGAGLLFLVLEDVRIGLEALMSLAGASSDDDATHLLERAARLPAVTGAALFAREDGRGARLLRGVGRCAEWAREGVDPGLLQLVASVASSATARSDGRTEGTSIDRRYSGGHAAALLIPRATDKPEVLVLVGEARNPFAALDDAFLAALGRQIGAALDRTELNRRLSARTNDLAHLSTRMIQQHEEERRRLSLELHDETAQVFSAVKLQLGVLAEQTSGEVSRSITHVATLVDQGMQSIRQVTETLRPAVLDDLGLVAALRSLAAAFAESTSIAVDTRITGDTTTVAPDVELVLYRALQESLSNVSRHSNASHVLVTLEILAGTITLSVTDDGRDAPELDVDELQRGGHMGLAGMRERVLAVDGRFEIRRAVDGGITVTIQLPIEPRDAAS